MVAEARDLAVRSWQNFDESSMNIEGLSAAAAAAAAVLNPVPTKTENRKAAASAPKYLYLFRNFSET